MTANAPQDETASQPPLWSIGLAVLVILLAPLLLYSLAPPGPLRAGDTIFSHGEQRVVMHPAVVDSPSATSGRCLLDPGTPLIVDQTPSDRGDGLLVAQVQGTPSVESPFCSSHARVLVHENQVFQKPDLIMTVTAILNSWFQ